MPRLRSTCFHDSYASAFKPCACCGAAAQTMQSGGASVEEWVGKWAGRQMGGWLGSVSGPQLASMAWFGHVPVHAHPDPFPQLSYFTGCRQ